MNDNFLDRNFESNEDLSRSLDNPVDSLDDFIDEDFETALNAVEENFSEEVLAQNVPNAKEPTILASTDHSSEHVITATISPNTPSNTSVAFAGAEERKESSHKNAQNLGIFASDLIKSLFDEKISTTEDDIDKDILEIAAPEIEEQQIALKEIYDNLSPGFDAQQTQEVKRILHTLKGSARMVGLNKAGNVAHRVESILEYCENHHVPLVSIGEVLRNENQKIDFLINTSEIAPNKYAWLDGRDYFEDMSFYGESTQLSTAAENNLETQSGADNSLVEVPNSQSLGATEDKNPNQSNYNRPSQVVSGLNKQIRVRSSLLDALVNDAGEIRLTRSNLDEISNTYKKNSADLKSTTTQLQQILKEIELQAETQMQSQKEHHSASEDFDPLEFDRFTRLQELTRFMSEKVQDIYDTTLSTDSLNKQQSDILNQQGLLSNNILNELIRVRLVAVETVSEKLYQIVRTTSRELNKKVILEIEGEKTEVDRVVLDKMFDPIAHLIRNSIAHGVETIDQRSAAKKQIFGKIKMKTQLEGNYIVFTISDDGAGIDPERIRSIALSRKLIDPNVSYSEEEIINLIFVPGFSTADSVSKVAGRGVGMDVVQTEVRALGGNIKINSKVGFGTNFIISIPVSVATSQAMLCYSAKNMMAIPTMIIDSVLSLKKDKLKTAYLEGKITVQDEEYRLYYLGHLLGQSRQHLPEVKSYNNVIVVDYNNKKIAVHVDSIQGTTDILTKGVSLHFSKIIGVLGSTIMGDGTQGLILNPVLLLDHWSRLDKLPVWMAPSAENEANGSGTDLPQFDLPKEKIRVLVVDDSITVRKTTEKVLLNNNFEVILAKNGADALEQLQISLPEIILSDIEMPVMDGFDFLKNVKSTERYKNIPVIMITSRTADKHQQYAFSLGAQGFIGKPFQEKDLIRQIKSLVFQKKTVNSQ